MTASRPPPPPSKRPWYLIAALVASWIYGARLMGDGYEVLDFFRGDRPDIHEMTEAIPSAEARDAASAAGEHWLVVREAAKRREMPFGAVSLLLGGAMVLLAARSMAGREGSRSALVQVVAVHAGVMIAAFLYTKDLAIAEVAFQARLNDGFSPALMQRLGDAAAHARAEAMTPIMALIMRTSFSALIVVALTRSRARAFFRAPSPGPLGEQ